MKVNSFLEKITDKTLAELAEAVKKEQERRFLYYLKNTPNIKVKVLDYGSTPFFMYCVEYVGVHPVHPNSFLLADTPNGKTSWCIPERFATQKLEIA